MKELLKLKIVHFDLMETREPEYILPELHFKNRSSLEKYIEGLAIKTYVGYNNEVYPKYVVTKIYIIED